MHSPNEVFITLNVSKVLVTISQNSILRIYIDTGPVEADIVHCKINRFIKSSLYNVNIKCYLFFYFQCQRTVTQILASVTKVLFNFSMLYKIYDTGITVAVSIDNPSNLDSVLITVVKII